jgi:hypothetical protein
MIQLDASGAVQTLAAFEKAAQGSMHSFWQMTVDSQKAVEGLAAKTRALSETASTLRWGAGAGIGSIYGLSRVGMAGSGLENQSQTALTMLGRSVAAVMAPLTAEKIGYMNQFAGWIDRMSESQKAAIRTMTMFSATALTMSFVIPKLTSNIVALRTAMMAERTVAAAPTMRDLVLSASAGKMVGAAGAGKEASAGGGALAAFGGPWAIAAGVVISSLTATEKGRESLAGLLRSLEPLFETLTNAVQTLANAIDALSPLVYLVGETLKPLFSVLNGIMADIKWLTSWLPGAGQKGGSGNSGIGSAPAGAEDIEQTWFRIMAASTRMDMQRRTMEACESSAQSLGAMAGAMQGQELGRGLVAAVI